MSYQVLARKYRPQRFQEVVGQLHVTQTLQNALVSKRIHHAYLFTGARGVGKTTVARILAKGLNCEKGPTKEPCNVCIPCQEVLEGKSLDVQEIDGASNTGVDDVRQIREQVKYMPAHGSYKVYIIDEVHMLSTSAFNALLKTLEEPPPHIVFVFATTEPHKIPTTILSRCQRYDFRRIPTAELAKALEAIAVSEKVTLSKDALQLIAHEAAGSLRDGQSLLDQAIAFAGAKIDYETLKQMLGFSDRTQLWALLEAVLKKDRRVCLDQLDRFYQTGADLNRLAQDLVFHFRNLLLLASLKETPQWLDLPEEELRTLEVLSKTADVTILDQLFQLAYRGVEEIARSHYPKMLFEVMLIRMSQAEEVVPVAELLEKLEKMGTTSAMVQKGTAQVVPASSEGRLAKQGKPQSMPQPEKTWEGFVAWLSKEKPQLKSIVEHGRLASVQPKTVVLGFEPNSVYGEMLKEEDRAEQCRILLTRYFGRPLQLNVTDVEGNESLPAEKKESKKKALKEAVLKDPSVQEAANVFGATVEDVRTELD